ncbi:hypothetical protein LINGRAHAP2_LOCUS2580 [Linum grandiflorum]
MVKVDRKGVVDREAFLDKCLVFRMVRTEMSEIDWGLFGVWAQKWWGVEVGDRHSLSDDLWLVKLPRKEDIERILRLRRWSFMEWSIVADRWMPFAGRSKVASKRGILWLRLEGIPLHLRSPALFRQMGSYCGNFLNFDVRGCSWNSVRVKVKQEGVIPCKILLSFEGQFYDVKVTVEDGGDFVEG